MIVHVWQTRLLFHSILVEAWIPVHSASQVRSLSMAVLGHDGFLFLVRAADGAQILWHAATEERQRLPPGPWRLAFRNGRGVLGGPDGSSKWARHFLASREAFVVEKEGEEEEEEEEEKQQSLDARIYIVDKTSGEKCWLRDCRAKAPAQHNLELKCFSMGGDAAAVTLVWHRFPYSVGGAYCFHELRVFQDFWEAHRQSVRALFIVVLAILFF